MTRLVRVQLGTAPGQGKQAVNQATAFKRQMKSVLPAVDGGWLVLVTDQGRVGVEAVCAAHTPGAEEWSKRAEGLSAEVWQTVSDRRKERAR